MKSLTRIRKRVGRCYELAFKVMLDEAHVDRFRLAHGCVSMVPNSTRDDCFMGHAWIILDDGRVYDPVLNVYMHRSAYEATYRAAVEHSYSKVEAAKAMAAARHYGPWE